MNSSMRIYKKNNANRKIPAILVFFLIWFSQDSVTFGATQTGIFAIIRNSVSLLILVWLFFLNLQSKTIGKSVTIAYLLLISGLLLSMVANNDFGAEYWLLASTTAFLVVRYYDIEDYFNTFSVVMFWIALFYSVGWVFVRYNINFLDRPMFHFLERIRLVASHSEKLYIYRDTPGLFRSYGIFREPGVYQMYLLLAGIYTVFSKKADKKRIIVYILALLLTRSTTGYLSAAMMMLGFILVKPKTKAQWKYSVIILGVMIIGICNSGLIETVINKFTNPQSAHSTKSRMASLIVNVDFWLRKPIFGIGINSLFEDFADRAFELVGEGGLGLQIVDDTNTVLLFFAAFGTLVGVVFLVGILLFPIYLADNFMVWFTIEIVLLFGFCGEAVNASVYPYILMLYGYAQVYNGKIKKKEIIVEKNGCINNRARL